MIYPVAKCHSQLSKLENEDIISQIVGIGWFCNQNGDRVSKANKSCYIWSMRLKRFGKNMANMDLCL